MIPAAVLALFASLAYGTSDFVAGLSSRCLTPVAVAYVYADGGAGLGRHGLCSFLVPGPGPSIRYGTS